ncbi:hypothetical protein BS47DRAFT_1343359 [Hydnum rufescens UP504]|uniref:Uncharacterized protein n=1 Tax=Hydnum rufescens UP504 TaxID=1448309 RepID=A0A9P6DXU4_9AGAM|nr:hypothetical protein BS47DRAFT_1343359 [Hydnum rufescens UP504]
MSKHAGENLQHTALKRVKVIPPATDEVGALGTEADNLISDSATPSTPVLNTTGTGTSMVGNVPPTPTPIQRTKVGLKKTPRRRKQPIGASPHRTPTAAIRQKKKGKST